MLRIILGFAFIGIAVAVLVTLLVGTEVPPINQIMASLFCETGEAFTVSSTRLNSNTYNMTYACTIAGESKRDVTPDVVLLVVIVFSAVVIIGIGFMIAGARGLARGKIRAATNAVGFDLPMNQPFTRSTSSTVITLDGKTVQASDLPPETARQLNDMLNLAGMKLDALTRDQVVSGTSVGSGMTSDLTSRLKQIEQARDAGLITEDEYSRLRREILDSLA